ncbi:MAG TPA: MFS transporter [Kofleriaceae bacterium]|nr:MFS transporter [Kofleriaceae bacterium]
MMRRFGVTTALLLAAASAGVVIPVLRALVESAGHGSVAASVFVNAHVVGGVIGAALGTRVLGPARSARTLAAAALIGSVAATLAMALLDSFSLRVGLRFVDGACHLLAITALVAAGTAGDAELRARRAVRLGIAIVLGVAGGFGLGGALHEPRVALETAALLSAAALLATLTLAARPDWTPAPEPHARPAGPAEPAPAIPTAGRRPGAPGLLAFGERFVFGSLSIAGPFLAPSSRVGLVIGVAMSTSVLAMPLARRYAQRAGARRLAVRSTLAFAATLAAAPIADALASSGRALAWAIACGAAAGALYTTALVLVARSAVLAERARDMATVHAAGNAGFALGALCTGVLIPVLPGMLVVALPGIAIVAAATVAVWITVPEAARDCPVIGGLAALGSEPTAGESARQPVT